jgi:hypothetical protein
MTTVSPGGYPQASLIWFERRVADIALFAFESSVKVRNLRLDPRVVMIVIDPVRELAAGTPAYVRLAGTGEIVAPEPDMPDRLARKYGIADGYPWELEPFVTIHIRVNRVSGMGPDPTGGLSGWADPA